MTEEISPHEEDAPQEKSPGPAEPTPMVIWIQDGPVCVTIVESPPHVPCGACQCAACRAHGPDPAVRFY